MAAEKLGADKSDLKFETRTKPTLKTIAGLSGLAVPTVSRALNDAPDIGQKTKVLVRKIAAEIGYVPNRAGVRLRTGRTNVISLVMPTHHDPMNHTTRLISSVAGALRHTQYHLVVTPYFPDQDPLEPVRYIVETGSADAIIFNQVEQEDPRVQYLLERNFPFATHGRSNWAKQHPFYDFDNYTFGRIAAQQLADRGRRTIRMIAPPLAHHYSRHMIQGVTDVAKERGMKLTVEEGINSDSESQEIVAYLSDKLRLNPDTDAIITASTSSAMFAACAMNKAGLMIGDNADLFTKEAMPFLKLFSEEIMTISEQVGSAGEFLAKAAIQAVRNPKAPPMQCLEVPPMPNQ